MRELRFVQFSAFVSGLVRAPPQRACALIATSGSNSPRAATRLKNAKRMCYFIYWRISSACRVVLAQYIVPRGVCAHGGASRARRSARRAFCMQGTPDSSVVIICVFKPSPTCELSRALIGWSVVCSLVVLLVLACAFFSDESHKTTIFHAFERPVHDQ